MKLSALEAVVAKIRASSPTQDIEVLFCDYSERGFPTLDLDKGFTVENYQVEDHKRFAGKYIGAVDIPIGRVSED